MTKKTLNRANLTALGAARLTDLLLEVSTGSADIKRRLRLELSHDLGPAELGRDVRKRLVALRRSTSFVGWRKRKALVKDLQTQVEMIVGKIGPQDPTLAFDLLWQFLELAPSVYERTDDSRGDVGDVFRGAITGFDDLSPRTLLDPTILAGRVWEAVCDNGYGEFDGIIAHVAPALGADGFAKLKALVSDFAAEPLQNPEGTDHEALQFLRELRGITDDYRVDAKTRLIKMILQDIAEAEGDTNAYIAQYSAQDIARPDIAAEVALILLAEAKPNDALECLEAAELTGDVFHLVEWDKAYIACLEALNRMKDAQAHRWTRFCETLNEQLLRSYLKELPDFEDIEAEDRARAHAHSFPDGMAALRFLINWPDFSAAATLVVDRITELDGNRYDVLTPAAEALRDRHPLAAALLWRALINFALNQGRVKRYGHAADHVADCKQVDTHIEDYGSYLTHEAYVQMLRTRHERKTSFWSKLS